MESVPVSCGAKDEVWNTLMPKKMERELKKEAKKKFPKDRERQDRYIYGTMRKTGWKPSREKRGR